MPTPRDDLLRLEADNRIFLERLDVRTLREINEVYREVRTDIETLIRIRKDELANPFGMTPLDEQRALRQLATDLRLFQQIDARMGTLADEVAQRSRSAWDSAIQGAEDVAAEEGQIIAEGLDAAIRLGFGQVDYLTVEVGLEDALQLLLQDQQRVGQVLRAELRSSLIRGESFDQIVARLLGADSSVFARGRISAALGARRNVIEANNGARDLYYRHWSEQVPGGLQKQALATVGPNTTDCCLQVHGQIQPLDQPYQLTGTPRFADEKMYPGFHWNCRSSSVAYREEWDADSALPTSVMEARAKAERERRSEG